MLSSRRRIARSVVVCVCLVVMLLITVAYINAESKGGSHKTDSPSPVRVTSHSGCGTSGQTLCSEEGILTRYVGLNDFSDILENQLPTTVLCNGSTDLQSYCQGGVSNLTIQLFKIEQDQKTLYMTRNQYITFLMSYDSQYGPFAYVNTAVSGTTATMSFENEAKTYTLAMVVSDSGSAGWQVIYPSIGPV